MKTPSRQKRVLRTVPDFEDNSLRFVFLMVFSSTFDFVLIA